MKILNMPQTELETRFKNFKVKKITLETNSPNLKIRFDDNEKIEYKTKLGLNNTIKRAKELPVIIEIEPFKINDEKVNVPIASFISI